MKNVFVNARQVLSEQAFTLVEMLMALLIISFILSASLPIISQRTKTAAAAASKYSPMPIGAIIMWKADGALPDNSWLEANGQAVPKGTEYEDVRRIYGTRLPDLRGTDKEFYDNLNKYLSKDIKDYLQNVIKPIPKNLIAIWGTNDAIPSGWSEASEYRGIFLRGYGQTPSLTQSWVDSQNIKRKTTTVYSSGNIGEFQSDTIRNMYGYFNGIVFYTWLTLSSGVFYSIKEGPGANVGVGSPAYSHLLDSAATYFDAAHSVPVSNEIRPVNKAVRYIKYTNTAVIPNFPDPPSYSQKFRYIVKVRN